MVKLTKNDLENLSKLPDNKWVEADDMYPKIKRADYSLRRLEKAGYVKMDVRGDLPYVFFMKIKEAPQTSEQIARGIVNKFYQPLGHLNCKASSDKMWGYAKERAIESIDEILQQLQKTFKQYGIGFMGKSELGHDFAKWSTYKTWAQVKKAIIKL